jgi:hypothetical protein
MCLCGKLCVLKLVMSSVRTNFPFSSQDYDEIPDILSLEKGEVLTDVLLLEGGWWYGKKSR